MVKNHIRSDGVKVPVVTVAEGVPEGMAEKEPVLTEEELRQLPQNPLGDFWTVMDYPDVLVNQLSREELVRLEYLIAGTQE